MAPLVPFWELHLPWVLKLGRTPCLRAHPPTQDSPRWFSEVFPKCFTEFSDKNICHYSKRAQTCHTATSCVRDQDATTVPARHVWKTGSLNWAQFMLLWFSESLNSLNSMKVLLYLGKTPVSSVLFTLIFSGLSQWCPLCGGSCNCKFAILIGGSLH